MSINTSLIMSAIAAISGSFIPRVVTAGVPSRTPLAWKGGTRLERYRILVHRDAGPSSSAIWQSFPVSPFAPTSTSIRWLSVPPLTSR